MNFTNFFGPPQGNNNNPLRAFLPQDLPKPLRRFFEEAEEVLNHSDKYQLSVWWSIKNLILVGKQVDFWKWLFLFIYPTVHQIRETAVDRLSIQYAPWGFLIGLFGGLFFSDNEKIFGPIVKNPLYLKIRSWKGLDFNKRVYLFGNPPAPTNSKPDDPIPISDDELQKLSSTSLIKIELLNYFIPVTGLWMMTKSLNWADNQIHGNASPFHQPTPKTLYHPQIGYYQPLSQMTKNNSKSSFLFNFLRIISIFGVNIGGIMQGYFSAIRLKKAYQYINRNPIDFNQLRNSNELVPLFLSQGTASFLTNIYPDACRTFTSVTHAFSLRGCSGFVYDSLMLIMLVATGFFAFRKS